ncbi:kinase-like domain-containing protein [Phaeosphaeria sp. MPI-PUGE-AT-0046c]|nr:kinase-like domain-containing protein [Phaeosphaeria sp. MPI-PUGE-AT-0046c]
MSMFRKPGEDSSSSSEESDEHTQDDVTESSHQDSVLSRIQTLESSASAPQRPSPHPLEMRQNSTQNVRDLMLHALLEEKSISEAAQRLGKDASDPEVQRVGREAYRELARQLASNVDDTYAGEDMRNHRATAQEGISKLTRNNLSRLAAVPEGEAQALVTRPPHGPGPALNIVPQPSAGFDVLSGINAPIEIQLRGYPGLQTDRYAREFSELEIVGKGGYGKVFKAKHNLDGSIYAVKRIPVSPAKLDKMQKDGSDELGSILQEVRSLAQFDHTNIVRYHNAWLEFTTAPHEEPAVVDGALLRPDRLLENVVALSASPPSSNDLHARFDDISFSDPFERPEDSYGAGVVFEASENGIGFDTSKSEVDNLSYKAHLKSASRRKARRGSQASQATIATISSTKSRMSAVEDVDEDDEEEDIEMIPRSHLPNTQLIGSDVTESMVTQSDMPAHLVPIRNTGPILTLNVQMSLCETNLAAFLSADRRTTATMDGHCFHPCITLELLWNIISGVEYLHAQGVVHRDLKPANVFLSISRARHPPYGSVDLSSCMSCEKREPLHLTPRIGDFGLVAALDDSCLGIGSVKPVGTEYYRPVTSARIDEKLDVFALGVMGFEMLCKFDTRMERVAALANFRRGIFPDDFSQGLGDHDANMQYLLSSMVHPDEQQRMGCEEVKSGMSRLIHLFKA